jgi:Bacterial TniB protein
MTDTLMDRVEALKSADDATRLAFLDECHTIYHPGMLVIENTLRAIVESPQPYEKHCAFFARSFNGKSTVSKHFASLYPPELNALGDAAIVKVARVSMPGEASVREFAIRILTAVGEPFNQRWSTSHLMSCAYAVLKALSVKLLIVDEFQDLANGTFRNRQALKNVIKSIGEDTGCGVALFGTPDGVSIIVEDSQLARRFEHAIISPWVVDEATVVMLHNIVAHLPLRKASPIASDRQLVEKIVELGEGVIGHMRRVILEAARTAIVTGREVIDLKTVAAIGWVPLSLRAEHTWNALGASDNERLGRAG